MTLEAEQDEAEEDESQAFGEHHDQQMNRSETHAFFDRLAGSTGPVSGDTTSFESVLKSGPKDRIAMKLEEMRAHRR